MEFDGQQLEKICTSCNTSKKLDQYWKLKHGKFGRWSKCIQCITTRNKMLREADPEKFKVRRRNYYLMNKEASNKASRQWHYDNAEYSKASKRAYCLKNKEKHAARGKAYAEKHKERLKALAKLKKKNPEIDRLHCAKRRARKLKAGGSFTVSQIRSLFQSQKKKCVVCQCCIKNGYHIDHIKPLSRGGDNSIRNIQLLCQPCNSSKHAKDPIEFMQERGFLL